MRKSRKKILVTLAVIAALIGAALLLFRRDTENFREKYEGVDLEKDVAGMERTGTYTGYLIDHEDAALPDQTIPVDLFDYECNFKS